MSPVLGRGRARLPLTREQWSEYNRGVSAVNDEIERLRAEADAGVRALRAQGAARQRAILAAERRGALILLGLAALWGAVVAGVAAHGAGASAVAERPMRLEAWGCAGYPAEERLRAVEEDHLPPCRVVARIGSVEAQ